MKIQGFHFGMYHGKNPPPGSSQIRVLQLMRYWDDYTLYRYGDNPDVLIFQKVYITPDYKFPAHYPGIKILDITDPDWLEGALIRETIDAMHAVTCSTEALATFLRQLTDKPVQVIPDRFDLELIPDRIPHIKPASRVLWFGYRHNASSLKPAIELIDKLGLHLTVISDDDPMAWQWLPRQNAEAFKSGRRYKYLKYKEETIYQDMQQCDFAILPDGTRPQDHFKSNNRTIKAILAGLPVAKTREEVECFIDAHNRERYMRLHYDEAKELFDVRKSVAEYKELIARLA